MDKQSKELLENMPQNFRKVLSEWVFTEDIQQIWMDSIANHRTYYIVEYNKPNNILRCSRLFGVNKLDNVQISIDKEIQL